MAEGAAQTFQFGSFQLEMENGILFKNGTVVPLTPKANQILLLLVRQQGRLVGKDEILREVWTDTFVEESSIVRNISVLRKILQEENNCYIETFHKRGYRFVAPLQKISAPTVKTPQKIAVLPFTLLNANSENEHLGLGLADTLTTHLSNFEQIAVRPTTAVLKYTAPDPFAAGQELKVEAVIHGSIQFVENRLRINLQLVNVQTQRAVWGLHLDGELTDLLEIQDNISRQVVRRLLPEISAADAAAPTINSEIYQIYLRGRFHWNKRTAADLRKAADFLRQAVIQDPNFALAFTGLADCLLVLGDFDHANRPALCEQARRAVKRALEINPALGEALATLAHVRLFTDWATNEVEELYQQSIALKPNYAVARHWYGVFLTLGGRYQEAVEQLSRAVLLDPLSPIFNRSLATCYAYADQFDEAFVQYAATLEIEPHFIPALYGEAILHNRLGNDAEALRRMREAERIAPDNPLVFHGLAQIHARAGRRPDALAYLEKGKKTLLPFERALTYNFLGEREAAFENLQKAVSERDATVLFLKVYPDFRNLHDDPRFIALINQIERG